jgi:hydrogenase-4 component B
MSVLVLLLPMLLPLALAALVLAPASRATALRLAPWAPLPALILAFTVPLDLRLDLPAVLLGTTLGLDDSGRLFLQFSALVWLVASLFARGWLRDDARQPRFWAFFLATQAGNLGLCLALDAASFYLLFALMTFAAYGLVVHSGSPEALRAGRVYLTMAVAGEAALVAGMLLAVVASGSHAFDILSASALSGPAAALLISGFGIKVGVPLLHMWLPLAHPVAPVPASAVLSGVMLKAGLLGWLRFLPLGSHALPEAGTMLMLAGLAAMFLGVAAGLAQREPKVLLAYSSVSQMGYMTLAVGAGLAAPALWPLLLPAVGLYAFHHALAKSALFLGAGLVRVHGMTRLRLAGLALPALALAGAPMSSGLLAKTQLKIAFDSLSAPWAEVVITLLPFAALGTALLMARLLWLVWDKYRDSAASARPPPAGVRMSWLTGVLASLVLVWMLAPEGLRAHVLGYAVLLDAAWPPIAAAVLARIALRRRWRAPALPPGDVLLLLTACLDGLHRMLVARRWPRPPARLPDYIVRTARLQRPDATGMAGNLAGLLWLALLAALVALLASG